MRQNETFFFTWWIKHLCCDRIVMVTWKVFNTINNNYTDSSCTRHDVQYIMKITTLITTEYHITWEFSINKHKFHNYLWEDFCDIILLRSSITLLLIEFCLSNINIIATYKFDNSNELVMFCDCTQNSEILFDAFELCHHMTMVAKCI